MSPSPGPERLRVAAVSSSRQAWGAERAVMALAAPLADRGIELILASPPGGDLQEQWTTMGLRHVPLEIPERNGVRGPDGDSPPSAGQLAAEGLTTLRSVRRIARTARAVDVVHSNSLWTHFDCAVAGRLARRPVVLDLHDIVRPGVGRRLLTTAVALSSAAVAVSRAVADCVGPSGSRHLQVTFPAVDLDVFRPGPPDPETRRRLTSSPTDPLVGIIGRLDPEKGVDLVMRAVSALDGPAGTAHLVVVGSPAFGSDAYLEHLRAEAGRLLGDRVRFVGRIEDVPETLRALDVLVNASVAEPFGLGVLEAQAAGVPVVATGGGGVTDFLTDGDNALLVPVGDAAAMTTALGRLLRDPELGVRLACRGRAVAEAGHGIDLFADAMADLYRRLAHRPPEAVDAESGR
ncbi:MAG TPA: glycosyltransferase family 4 protein [Acidimicrobiales bacterium]|nr:glycosyltransferase family 4 protein [Acidimicrobiales bacterium]